MGLQPAERYQDARAFAQALRDMGEASSKADVSS
jgi:hypothetical protein